MNVDIPDGICPVNEVSKLKGFHCKQGQVYQGHILYYSAVGTKEAEKEKKNVWKTRKLNSNYANNKFIR